MTNKIEGKIVAQRVATEAKPEPQKEVLELEVRLSKDTIDAVLSKAVEVELAMERRKMSESVERPPVLRGRTVKIKTPTSPHAIYLTINDILLAEGTPFAMYHPYEVFINTKDATHFQWMVALTRLMSAVFRKGGDVSFLVEEMKSVFDPQGGYFKNGVFMPSLIAEVGEVIEEHLKELGLMNKHGLAVVPETKYGTTDQPGEVKGDGFAVDQDLKNATRCTKCFSNAVIVLDGCPTCTACGDSKCG